MRLRLTVYLAAAHQIRGSSEGGSERQPPGLESGLESLADRILMCLLPSPLSKSELAKALGYNSISSKLNQRVNELLKRGEIIRTLPNKPTSRLQKYRLTDSGNARIQLMASNKDNSVHGNDK